MGMLDEIQMLVTARTRPEEELYDLSDDPFEINNLAGIEQHAELLEQMREDLLYWIVETGDKGMVPETEKMYDSDMTVYLEKRVNLALRENIALMKEWAREGK